MKNKNHQESATLSSSRGNDADETHTQPQFGRRRRRRRKRHLLLQRFHRILFFSVFSVLFLFRSETARFVVHSAPTLTLSHAQRQGRRRRRHGRSSVPPTILPPPRHLAQWMQHGTIRDDGLSIQFAPLLQGPSTTTMGHDKEEWKEIQDRAQRLWTQHLQDVCHSLTPTFGNPPTVRLDLVQDHVEAGLHYFYDCDCRTVGATTRTTTNTNHNHTTNNNVFGHTATTSSFSSNVNDPNHNSATTPVEHGALVALSRLTTLLAQEQQYQSVPLQPHPQQDSQTKTKPSGSFTTHGQPPRLRSSSSSSSATITAALPPDDQNHNDKDNPTDTFLGIARIDLWHEIVPTVVAVDSQPLPHHLFPQTKPKQTARTRKPQDSSSSPKMTTMTDWEDAPHTNPHERRRMDSNDANDSDETDDDDNTTPGMMHPNDPLYPQQSHYSALNFSAAWEYWYTHQTSTDTPDEKEEFQTIVQVVDTGWDVKHADSGDNQWVNPGETDCYDGIDNDGNGYIDDCHGYNHADNTSAILLGDGSHGSHVTGTIAANTHNGKGVAGIAGFAQLNVRILTSVTFGKSNVRGFAQALVYAADMGAHISSNSWGYTSPNYISGPLETAIEYATNKGVLIVFAAGNFNSNQTYYPAAHPKVLSVAATYNNGERAPFSNYGDGVDVAAPGINVLSTGLYRSQVNRHDYQFMSGTSMSCPHVAGVLALGKSFQPQASADDLRTCLLSSATSLTDQNEDHEELGAGMVHPLGFLQCLDTLEFNSTSNNDNTTTATPTPSGGGTESTPPTTTPSSSVPPSATPTILDDPCDLCGDCQEARRPGIPVLDKTGCQCASCQAKICASDPWCCAQEWDLICANAAKVECPCRCNDGAHCGTCLDDSRSHTKGCNCPACESLVCRDYPWCCTTVWNAACVTAVATACTCSSTSAPTATTRPTSTPTERPTRTPTLVPTLSAMPTNPPTNNSTVLHCEDQDSCGNCNTFQPEKSDRTKGCSCSTCESRVCLWDLWCCSVEWDAKCAQMANRICACHGPDCDGTQHCTSPAPWPGCPSCPQCQALVCANTPDCCTVQWDNQCASLAGTLCAVPPT